MRFMIQDMLDLAQIRSGKFRKNIKKFDIRESIEKVMCVQRQQAADKNIKLFVKYLNIQDPVVDQEYNSPFICCDENRVMQVLLGLQSNAIKFTQVGKVQIDVSITKDQFLQISVIDTGTGIAEDQ